jgi:hypothetical protein
MDPNDPAQSPHGVYFLPQLPPITSEPDGQEPFTAGLDDEFETLVRDGPNRKILTPTRRWEMRTILRNPTKRVETLFNVEDPYSAELARLRTLRNWTIRHFELQDQQVYRSAETVRGVELPARYCLCTYDAFECLARLHRGLYHAGKYFHSPSYSHCLLVDLLSRNQPYPRTSYRALLRSYSRQYHVGS